MRKIFIAAVVSWAILLLTIAGIGLVKEPQPPKAGIAQTKRSTTIQPTQTQARIAEASVMLPDTKETQDTHPYTDEDILLLARVINAEMGADWVPDEVQRMVGSVVLNRVASDKFPDSIYDVVYQEGQYACAWNGSLDKEVTEKVWSNAVYLLEHGNILLADVLYQSTNASNGSGIHAKYYDSVMKNTTCFCYG